MRNLPSFLALQAVTILRFYTMYRPLRVFMTTGVALIAGGVASGRYASWHSTPWAAAPGTSNR